MTNSENFDLKSLKEFKKEFGDEGSKPNQLEKLLNKFNVFDVLNIVNAEIRHSNVLAWLLDPNESHNTGDNALKLFLKSIPSGAESTSGVDLTSLINGSSKIDNIEVRKEEKIPNGKRIDISILIMSGSKRFLIIIENKIEAKDTKKQLKDYRNWAENKFKEDYKKIFIYLTPDGEEPKDKKELEYWDLFSYGLIEKDILNKVLLEAEGDIQKFLQQYVDILGRIILENSKVKELCSEIYKKHKKAINLIFNAKGDTQKELQSFVKDKIKNGNYIIEESSKGSGVKFITFTTNTLSEKTKTNKNLSTLVFQFVNEPNSFRFTLSLRQGEDGNQLLSFMKREKKIFTSIKDNTKETKPKGTKVAYSKTILKPVDYGRQGTVEEDRSELTKKIDKKWPSIVKKIQEIDEVFNNKWTN